MLRAIYDFAFAPLYFSSPKVPAPAPVAQAVDNEAIDRKRTEQERMAIAESKLSGRRSTIVGGGLIAQEEQIDRGLLSQRKRAAAKAVMLG